MTNIFLFEKFKEIPDNFYLVTNIDFIIPINNRFKSDIRKGYLENTTGVSSSYEIINKLLDVRTLLIKMNGYEFFKMNPNLERIMYSHKPDQLCQNNFEILKRLKNYRKNENVHLSILFNNCFRDLNNKRNLLDKSLLQYFERNMFEFGEVFEKDDVKIHTVGQFVNWMIKTYPKIRKETKNNVPYGTIPYNEEKLDKFKTYNILYNVFIQLGKVFEKEKEWLINSDKMFIPKNTEMFVNMKLIPSSWENKLIQFKKIITNLGYSCHFFPDHYDVYNYFNQDKLNN